MHQSDICIKLVLCPRSFQLYSSFTCMCVWSEFVKFMKKCVTTLEENVENCTETEEN